MRKGCQRDSSHVVRFVRSFPGAALLTSGALFRREYAFVDRASLLNKAGPFEVTLRDKLHNFAHARSKTKIREKMLDQWLPATIGSGPPAWEVLCPSQVIFSEPLGLGETQASAGG
jgi:hypothetical protein